MKTAIIVLVVWYVGLQVIVKRAEIKSQKIRDEKEKQRQLAIQEREEWAKQYNKRL